MSLTTDKHTTHLHNTQDPTQPLSTLLGEGARYCTIARCEKGPTYSGWNTHAVKTFAQVKRHASAGGNIGLVTGTPSQGLIVIDLDKNRDGVVSAHPWLLDTVEVYRDNAPERAKFILRCDGELPFSRKHHEQGIEILATGNQAVIVGMHATGATIRTRGARIVTVTKAQIDAMWTAVTGDTDAGRGKYADVTPDAEAVKRAQTTVDAILQDANIERRQWTKYGDGLRAVLRSCPVAPMTPDGAHKEDDHGTAIIIGADGRKGFVCSHARCTEHIHEHHAGNGWKAFSAAVGYTPTPDPDLIAQRNADRAAIVAIANSVGHWQRTADFSELIPVRYHSMYGYQTGNYDKRMFGNICAIMAGVGKIEDVAIGFHALAEKAGCSTGSVRKVIERLEAGKLLIVHRPEKDAWRYTLPPAIIDAANVTRLNTCIDLDSTYIEGSAETLGVQSCYIGNLPIATHAGHDIFSRSLSNLTPADLAQRNADRAAHDLPPMKRTNALDRRLAAAVGSAGPGALRIVDALFDAPGATLDRDELSERLHMHRQSLWRNVAKLVNLGIVELTDRHTVRLLDDWAQMADALAPVSANAGAQVRRRIARLDTVIFYCRQRMKDADLDTKTQLNRRLEKARAELKRLTGHDVQPEHVKEPRHRKPSTLRWDYAEIEREHADDYNAWKQTEGEPYQDRVHMMRVSGRTHADIQHAQRLERGLGARLATV